MWITMHWNSKCQEYKNDTQTDLAPALFNCVELCGVKVVKPSQVRGKKVCANGYGKQVTGYKPQRYHFPKNNYFGNITP